MADDSRAREGGWRRRHLLRERGWVGALVLIGIGVILLMENLGLPVPDNWWALLLLVPAAAAFLSAWRTYNREERVTTASAGPFAGGIVLVALAVIFLLNFQINWDLIGPVALILIGLGILARYFRRP